MSYEISVSFTALCSCCGKELPSGSYLTESKPGNGPFDRDNPYERKDRRVFIRPCPDCFEWKGPPAADGEAEYASWGAVSPRGVRGLDGQALSGETLMDSVSRIPASGALADSAPTVNPAQSEARQDGQEAASALSALPVGPSDEQIEALTKITEALHYAAASFASMGWSTRVIDNALYLASSLSHSAATPSLKGSQGKSSAGDGRDGGLKA